MRYLVYSSLLFLVACGSKKPATTLLQDSITIPVGIKQADFGHYHLAIQPRKEGQSSVLILYDRTTHAIDSIDLGEVSVDSEYTHITNVTQSLAFDKLALIIDWRGDSDHMYSKLVGYMGDTLKVIYEDPNPGGIKELSRKDQWTLTGLSFGQDPLTAEYNILCPLTISLKTGEGEIKMPDTAAVQFETEALEPILAHRISRSGAGMDYMIATGVAFRIDTIFNVSRTAVLSIGDSIRLKTGVDQLESKIKVSGAG
ncbi:MAG TPA: hypothetical protein VK518_01900 [Puia sp.]|nr:hypothetical protein [Puia sp.]